MKKILLGALIFTLLLGQTIAQDAADASCSEICKEEGYTAGYCDVYPIVPDAQMCVQGGNPWGPYGECTIPPGTAGGGYTCCCTGEDGDIDAPEYPALVLPFLAAMGGLLIAVYVARH